MALVGRLFVIFFAILAASVIYAIIVAGAMVFSSLPPGPIDRGELNFDFNFVLDLMLLFALLPVAIAATTSEVVCIKRALTYAVGGVLFSAACFLGLILSHPSHLGRVALLNLGITTSAGIIAGLIYWMIAGRNAGAWREARLSTKD